MPGFSQRNPKKDADEIERLGEVQRFALKVIGDRVVDATEHQKLPQGRVITPH